MPAKRTKARRGKLKRGRIYRNETELWCVSSQAVEASLGVAPIFVACVENFTAQINAENQRIH